MKSDIDYIKMEALSLDEGGTLQTTCPSCGKEKLSISRGEEGIVYNCWIPYCSMSGFIGSLPSDFLKKKEIVFKPRNFSESLLSISNNFYHEHLEQYGIHMATYKAAGIKKITGRRGISIPLYDHNGRKFGTTTKFWDNDTKALHYIEKDYPKIHFVPHRVPAMYKNHEETIVLCEDVLSAMKVQNATGYQGAALLGTSMDDSKVRALHEGGFRNVVLWLDYDAVDKAAQIQKKYSLFFRKFNRLVTVEDPKATSKSTIKRLICQVME